MLSYFIGAFDGFRWQYTLLQNDRHFSIPLFTRKLVLVASIEGTYSFEFGVYKHEAKRANL